MARVSVIMPTYNCGQYIDESIRSVLDQSYSDLELLVINNGSDDDTDVIVGRYMDDPRLRYIKISDKNVSKARNTGIKNAKGDLIAFLDADDIFLKDKISKQVKLFDKTKGSSASYTNEVYFKEGLKRKTLSTYYRFSGDIFYYLKRNDFIHTSTFMVKKSVLTGNSFDETLSGHEDWDLFLRLALKKVYFTYINEPLTNVRLRKTSATENTHLMDTTRREVGLRARGYWKEFKKEMNPFSLEGQGAILRYLKFKLGAFLIGFPRRECFNRPVPQELL